MYTLQQGAFTLYDLLSHNGVFLRCSYTVWAMYVCRLFIAIMPFFLRFKIFASVYVTSCSLVVSYIFIYSGLFVSCSEVSNYMYMYLVICLLRLSIFCRIWWNRVDSSSYFFYRLNSDNIITCICLSHNYQKKVKNLLCWPTCFIPLVLHMFKTAFWWYMLVII